MTPKTEGKKGLTQQETRARELLRVFYVQPLQTLLSLHCRCIYCHLKPA